MDGKNDGIGDLVRGALAGMVATWAMGQVTTLMYAQEDEQAREREERARGGKSAYGIAAEKTASAVGLDLTDEQRQRAGSAAHWALGAGAGALYGAIRHRVPLADAGTGTLFGAAFFLGMDEVGNAALGLTPGPRSFPWQAHVRGLVGHLAFGLTAELTLRVLDRLD